MSVTIATSNLPTLSHDFNMSDSRVDRLLNANSLEEAQQMGIIDRLIDYIFGGGKREAIAEAYTAITKNEDASADADTRKLSRFESLKSLALPEHADKFKTSVTIDNAAGKWGYEFSIDNTSIFKSEMRNIDSGHALATHQDAVLWSNLDMALKGREDAADIMADWEPLKAQFAAQNEAVFEVSHPTVDLAQKFTQIAKNLQEKGVEVEMKVTLSYNESGEPAHKFSMKVNGKEVHKGLIGQHRFDVGVAKGEAHAESPDFYDLNEISPFTAITMAGIEIQMRTDLTSQKQYLENNTNLIEARMQTMVDNPVHRSALEAALDDPAYGSAAYTGFKPGPTVDSYETFIAMFGDRELTFSDRSTSTGEYRGVTLKDKLQNSTFTTLRELFSEGHLTERDSLLIYASVPSKFDFYSDSIEAMSALEQEQTYHALHEFPVFNTTLGKLFDVPKPKILGSEADGVDSSPIDWA